MDPPESPTQAQSTQSQGVPREPPHMPRGTCVPQYSHKISIYPQDNPYPPIQPQLPPIHLHPQNAPSFFYAPPGHLCAPPRAPAWPYGAPGAPNTSRPPPAPPWHWGVHAQAARTPPSPNCTPPSQVLLLPGTAQWAAVRGKLRHRGTFQPECYPTPCLSFSSQGGILSTSLKKLHCHHPNCPSSTVGPQFALPVDFAGKDFIF